MLADFTGLIRLVVFDMAGTTVDYGSCAPVRAFLELFEKNGIKADPSIPRGISGMGKKDQIHRMLMNPEIYDQWMNIAGRIPNVNDLEHLYKEFIPLQLDNTARYSKVIDGVPETIEWLRENRIKIAGTSGYDRNMMNIAVRELEKEKVFLDVTYSSDQVPGGRPAPWMIFRCMEMTDTLETGSVINIGDTVSDMQAGRNAGVWAVGVIRSGNLIGMTKDEYLSADPEELDILVSEGRKTLYEAGAHVVIDFVSDLPEIIEIINSRGVNQPSEAVFEEYKRTRK